MSPLVRWVKVSDRFKVTQLHPRIHFQTGDLKGLERTINGFDSSVTAEDIMFFVDMVGSEALCYQQAIPITAGQGRPCRTLGLTSRVEDGNMFGD